MYDVYDFGAVKISRKEIEQMAIDAMFAEWGIQPSSAMTDVFYVGSELFVTVANVNGPIDTARVVVDHDRVFLEDLNADEFEAVEEARQQQLAVSDYKLGELFVFRAFGYMTNGDFANDYGNPFPEEFVIADVLRILRAALDGFEERHPAHACPTLSAA